MASLNQFSFIDGSRLTQMNVYVLLRAKRTLSISYSRMNM